MTLITTDELARGLALVVFGSAAGGVAIAVPGSPLWLLPAAIGLGASALTVPEIRQEAARALPGLLAAPSAARGFLSDFGQRGPRALPAAPAPQRAQEAAPRPSSAQRPAQSPQSGAAAPLRPAQWLEAVNERPDDNPHMMVVGPSGTGKTTFVSAALSKRPGRVIVLTPKVSPAAWRGAEVVTLDDELTYTPIAAALEALHLEAKQRAKRLQRGQALGEPLTVVLDEMPELHAEVKGLGVFAVRLSRWGRELGMRQVVLATNDDALNIPGWAATRPNYVRVELEKPTDDGARPAWLDDGRGRRPLELGNVKAGAERAQLRPWRAAPARPANPDVSAMLLAGLLVEPVSTSSQREDTPPAVSVSVSNPPDTDTDTDTPPPAVSTAFQRLDTPGGNVFYVSANATAPSAPPAPPPAPPAPPVRPGGRRRPRGRRVDVAGRRQLAELQRQEDKKAALREAYAARKAAGWSFRRANAELRGTSEEVREWWKQLPGPVGK